MSDTTKTEVTRAHLEAAGAPKEGLDAAAKMGIPWAALQALLAKYGPTLWALLVDLLPLVVAPVTP